MRKINEICEVEVVYRRPIISTMKNITCCDDIVEIFREMITDEKIDFKEFFLVALLSRSNQVLGVSKISMGTTNGTCVNIKEILQLAIKTNSTSIILCHNHPSGCLKASASDITLTENVKQACKLFDINLLDHILLTREGHHSLNDEI